jgi:hypothetical protein
MSNKDGKTHDGLIKLAGNISVAVESQVQDRENGLYLAEAGPGPY